MQIEANSNIESSRGNQEKFDDIGDDNWYPDSGTINHITNNLENLNLGQKEYRGNENIHMGNGESINVTHIGFGSIRGKKTNVLKCATNQEEFIKCISVC